MILGFGVFVCAPSKLRETKAQYMLSNVEQVREFLINVLNLL